MNSSGEQEGEHDDEQDCDVGGRRKIDYKGKRVNFYFTNFPNDLDESKLRDLFSNIGEVCDVYVARKMNKEGKKFGFARFLNVENTLDFEVRLNQLSIGNFKLKVNVAKYEKSLTNSNLRSIIKLPSSPYESECFNCIQIKVDCKVFEVRIPALFKNREVAISFKKVKETVQDINGMVDLSSSSFPSNTKVDFRPTVFNDTATEATLMADEDRKIKKVTSNTRDGGKLMPQVDDSVTVDVQQKVGPAARIADDDDREIKSSAGTKNLEGHVIDGDKSKKDDVGNDKSCLGHNIKIDVIDEGSNSNAFQSHSHTSQIPHLSSIEAHSSIYGLDDGIACRPIKKQPSGLVTTTTSIIGPSSYIDGFHHGNVNKCTTTKENDLSENLPSDTKLTSHDQNILPSRGACLSIGKGQKSTLKFQEKRKRKLKIKRTTLDNHKDSTTTSGRLDSKSDESYCLSREIQKYVKIFTRLGCNTEGREEEIGQILLEMRANGRIRF